MANTESGIKNGQLRVNGSYNAGIKQVSGSIGMRMVQKG